MNDLYKPVDVKRLMELAGVKEAPDMDDPIIRSRMGDTSVSTADIARASAEPLPPSKLTTSSGNPIASGTRGLNWNEQPKTEPAPTASVPDAQDFGSEPKITTAAPASSPVNTNPEPKIDPTLVSEPPGSTPVTPARPVRPSPAPAPVRPSPAPAPATNPARPSYVPQVQNYKPGVANAGRMKPTGDAVATNPATPGVQVGNYRPGAANAGRMNSANEPAMPAPRTSAYSQARANQAAGTAPAATTSTPVATNPAQPNAQRTGRYATARPMSAFAEPPATPAPRTSAYSQSRTNQQVRETSTDLARMQNLAGIRKN